MGQPLEQSGRHRHAGATDAGQEREDLRRTDQRCLTESTPRDASVGCDRRLVLGSHGYATATVAIAMVAVAAVARVVGTSPRRHHRRRLARPRRIDRAAAIRTHDDRASRVGLGVFGLPAETLGAEQDEAIDDEEERRRERLTEHRSERMLEYQAG